MHRDKTIFPRAQLFHELKSAFSDCFKSLIEKDEMVDLDKCFSSHAMLFSTTRHQKSEQIWQEICE